MAALGECGQGGFAGVHRPVVEDDFDRFVRRSRLRAVEPVEPFEKCSPSKITNSALALAAICVKPGVKNSAAMMP